MVKDLKKYVGKENYFGYKSLDGISNMFKGVILIEQDIKGNSQYFMVPCYDCGIKKQRIFSRGQKRVSLEDGVFVLDQNRRWNKVLEILNEN